MLHKRWQGCVFLLLALLCNASGTMIPSEFAKIIQSKQSKQARVCEADPELLRSLAGSEVEVMLTVPNEQLEHIAEFQEEADLWVIGNVARFLPATRITHVLAGDDVLTASPGSAYFVVPAMLNLHSALAAAGLASRVKVSSAVSGADLASPAWSGVARHMLRFLKVTGAPVFLKPSRPSAEEEATDDEVGGAYAAMRALGVPAVPVVAAEPGTGGEVTAHYYYDSSSPRGGVREESSEAGARRSLATGTFCVAVQSADPAALQAGLNWACGPGHADCSAIQPGGPCYKPNNLPALASYAYNDYYQKMSSTGATCSFNGTATTTTTDPSSGSCVFAGSTMAGGGSNSSVPVGASPPTSTSPPAGFAPPFGSSPPSSDFGPPAAGTAPPTGFTPPAGGGFGTPPSGFGPPSGGFGTPPSGFGPPGTLNGSGTFGPTGTLNPYGGACRGAVSRAMLSALSAVAVAVLLVSMDAV